MHRLVITVVTLLFLVAGRVADLATTFYFNPSLSGEGNPIVLLFGGGALSLISVSVLLFMLSSIGLLAFWRGESLILSTRPVSFATFLSIWLKRVALQRRPFGNYLPGASHWNEGLQAIRLFGVVLAWAMIFGSVTAVHAWFATRDISSSTTYQYVYSALRIGRFNYLPSIIAFGGCLFGAFLFFVSEYKYQFTKLPLREEQRL